jgi:hypothetical protein
LRKLIGHVQHCMAENKKKVSSHAEGQNQHLEQINQQLQAYLVAQYKQQEKLQDHLMKGAQPHATDSADDTNSTALTEPIKPSNELADYLYAHGLLETYKNETGIDPADIKKSDKTTQLDKAEAKAEAKEVESPKRVSSPAGNSDNQLDEIYADGIQEVFGKHQTLSTTFVSPKNIQPNNQSVTSHSKTQFRGFEVNPIKIAYSMLPTLLRNRKFGIALPSLPSVFPLPLTKPTSSSTQEPNAPAT